LVGKILILTGAFCISIGLMGVTTGRISIWAALVAIIGGAVIILWPYLRQIRDGRLTNPYE
jgi:hypothetical protein